MSIVTLTLQWGPITRPEVAAKASTLPTLPESPPPPPPTPPEDGSQEEIEAMLNEDQEPQPAEVTPPENPPSTSTPPPPIHVYDFGWRGQINGLTQPEREQFLKALPISGVGRPSEVPDAGAGISSKLVMDHLHNSGEVSREEMPMDFVFEYLKILVQMNYRVVASHAQTVNSNEHCSSAAVWTLHKDYDSRSPLVNAMAGLLP